ncbi:MAG TPA: NADP(H)-dependent aldo-keto reductase [Steroidobacteraceae bacterium]|nr:NADP(H)-dependent aldo-keto reductase [Steroidobacteraceae bacterium]
MQFRTLGRTDINVSLIGLGTMTFGQQNSEAEAHEQLDYAVAQGVNLIDTAEMYPVPPMAETQGRTEQFIGTWLKKRNNRDKVVLATKVAGPGRALGVTWLRDGGSKLDRKNIKQALHDSLRRLQTDYVDLYQLHWPDRRTNFFGKLGYEHVEPDESVPIEETLDALSECVREGKVRYIGVSNETPWGVNQYLRLADVRRQPRIVSIQNPYSLLNRSFEVGLAEIAIREHVGLLAYSPLGFGVLSGKFLNGARPANSRLTLWTRFSRYNGALAEEVTAAYVNIAREHGLDPSQMALAYAASRRFMTSVLVGATTLQQLRTNIASIDVRLNEDALKQIEAVHRRWSNPCP